MDLEQEFQKLMDEAVQKVIDRRDNDGLSAVEADDLIHMIAQRRQPREDAWSSSTQSCMDSYEYERDDAWNRSGLSC
jgi:frataxin-like iron-binding protein CyaY